MKAPSNRSGAEHELDKRERPIRSVDIALEAIVGDHQRSTALLDVKTHVGADTALELARADHL